MTILDIIALATAIAAIVLAWRASRQNADLSAKIDRLQSTVFQTRIDLRDMEERLENRIGVLDVAVQRATGEYRFDPKMPLVELYEIEPRAQNVLAAFHIGGCASCAVDESESLEQAVNERGANLDRVLAALSSLSPNGEAPELRVPNVHFEV